MKQLVSAIPILLLLAAAPTPAAAQSISPPISEYRGFKARGSFIVTNQTLFPLTVVLQPKGFKVTEDGDLYDVPLDTAAVKLRLSAMSFRLQPRQAYTVFYEATTDTVPYWFNVWSGITGSKTESGINLRIELPHVVYLYQKQKLAAGRHHHSLGALPASRQADRGRVRQQQPAAWPGAKRRRERREGAKSQEAAGFPLFPESIRRMRMPWADSLPPQRIEVRFDGFRLNSTDIVVDTTAAPPPAPADTAPPAAAKPAETRDSTATR